MRAACVNLEMRGNKVTSADGNLLVQCLHEFLAWKTIRPKSCHLFTIDV
jgi:hypothetical protein